MFCVVVRSVNTGTAARASSVRKNRAAGAPATPSPRYIRVLPLRSFVTANEGRSGSFALRLALICVKVTPPSVDRQVPWSNADAYRVFESLGSSAMSITPRMDALPSQMKLKVAPPSVDFQSPKGGRGVGGLDVTPPLVTELTPRTPRADAT